MRAPVVSTPTAQLPCAAVTTAADTRASGPRRYHTLSCLPTQLPIRALTLVLSRVWRRKMVTVMTKKSLASIMKVFVSQARYAVRILVAQVSACQQPTPPLVSQPSISLSSRPMALRTSCWGSSHLGVPHMVCSEASSAMSTTAGVLTCSLDVRYLTSSPLRRLKS